MSRVVARQGHGGWLYVLSRSKLRELGVYQYDMHLLIAPSDKEWGEDEIILVCDPPGPIDSAAIVSKKSPAPKENIQDAIYSHWLLDQLPSDSVAVIIGLGILELGAGKSLFEQAVVCQDLPQKRFF
ncbi:MAG: hypothetical protein ACXU9O_03270 [Gemmatimonadaceae bacterium]